MAERARRRHTVWLSDATEKSRIHHDRGADISAGDRREHGDLQRGRKRAAAPAALQTTRSTDRHLEYLSRFSAGGVVGRRLHRLEPPGEKFYRVGGIRR